MVLAVVDGGHAPQFRVSPRGAEHPEPIHLVRTGSHASVVHSHHGLSGSPTDPVTRDGNETGLLGSSRWVSVV